MIFQHVLAFTIDIMMAFALQSSSMTVYLRQSTTVKCIDQIAYVGILKVLLS